MQRNGVLRALVLVILLSVPLSATVRADVFKGGDVVPTTDPSEWNDSTTVEVGRTDAGSLTIKAGSDLTVRDARIGEGSTGAVTVDGEGSRWTMSKDSLYVGRWGTLNVTNGGAVSGVGTISGSATVDGTNSKWTSSHLFVGSFVAGERGKLKITNCGAVTCGDLSVTGYEEIAELDVNGGSVTCGHLDVGIGSTKGKLTITNGSVTCASLSVGVNGDGDGKMSITNGGTLTCSGQSSVGDNFSNGVVAVRGVGSVWSSSGDLILSDDSFPRSLSLTIADGGRVAAASAWIGSGARVAIDVGNGSVFDIGNGSGTVVNAGAVQMLAGAGTACGSYRPVLVGTMPNVMGQWQAIGGTWNAATHDFVVSAATIGSSGVKIEGINLASTQRVLISDDRGRDVGVSFLAQAKTINFTATAIRDSALSGLRALTVGQSVLSAWEFTANSDPTYGANSFYVSFEVGPGWSSDGFDLWYRSTTSPWYAYEAADLVYDGTYVSFTGDYFGSYAVSAVPEPSGLALLGITSLSLLAYARRKQRRMK